MARSHILAGLTQASNPVERSSRALFMGDCPRIPGVEASSCAAGVPSPRPEGRLFFRMAAAFDEFQRELVVENTRAGLAAASSPGGGNRPGRGRFPAQNRQNEREAPNGAARCVCGKTMRSMLDAPFAQVGKCFANGPGRSRRHMINAFARSSGQYIDYLRDKRLQFLKAVADAEHGTILLW